MARKIMQNNSTLLKTIPTRDMVASEYRTGSSFIEDKSKPASEGPKTRTSSESLSPPRYYDSEPSSQPPNYNTKSSTTTNRKRAPSQAISQTAGVDAETIAAV